MPNSELTKASITEEIKLKLGGSTIEVELTVADYEKSVRDAIRAYARNVPLYGRGVLSITPEVKRYVLNHPGLLGVTHVAFTTNPVEYSVVDPFNPYYGSSSILLSGDTTIGDLAQALVYVKDASAVISAEPEWASQWERVGSDNQFALYIDIRRPNVTASYTYTATYDYSDDPKYGLPGIPANDVDWIVAYSVARAKQILARIRGKFGGIVTPEGDTNPVSSDDLMAEGREDDAALLDEIRKRRRPLPPVIG